jgi:hypothetical protein
MAVLRVREFEVWGGASYRYCRSFENVRIARILRFHDDNFGCLTFIDNGFYTTSNEVESVLALNSGFF